MDFPRPSKSPSDLIGGLKDRFGFGNGQNRDGYDDYDEYYDDYYDEYAPESGQDGYYDDYAGEEYSNPYDRLEYTSRPTSRVASSRNRGASGDLSSHLVNADDVRATTHYRASEAASETAEMPALTESETAAFQPTEGFDVPKRTYSDFSSPYRAGSSQSARASRTSATAGSTGVSSTGSAGLDSLFEPTTGASSAAGSTATASSSRFADTSYTSAASTSATSTTASSDPYAAYEGSSSFAPSTTREISIVKPLSYDDASSVARSVRAGDIVVLSLRTTDDALSKRVLDFSFGVAAALGAQVDYVAEKTFVIIQGKELTLEERHRLQQQGIL